MHSKFEKKKKSKFEKKKNGATSKKKRGREMAVTGKKKKKIQNRKTKKKKKKGKVAVTINGKKKKKKNQDRATKLWSGQVYSKICVSESLSHDPTESNRDLSHQVKIQATKPLSWDTN